MKNRLPNRKEAYRLWFEYLRVARQSSDQKIRRALERSARFYERWGNIESVTFDHWWRENEHLFEEKSSVRRLSRGDKPADQTALIIEVPLTQPKGKLVAQVREIIRNAYPAQTPRKAHFRPVSQYRLSAGAEPRLLALREMLNVYRHVYLKNKNLRGQELLDKVHVYYRGRKRNKRIPSLLLVSELDEDNRRALRNMRRYISKAERVMLNVAKGEFPGRYE
jgi:hypothetical protein